MREVTAVFIVMSLACTAPLGERDGSAVAAAPARDSRAQTIDHLAPRRDSTAGVPPRFEWTPIEGADSYTFGLWNDIDILVWRQHGLRAPAVAWPKELEVEPGTYFWSVVALRDERVVAESGRSAFVILE